MGIFGASMVRCGAPKGVARGLRFKLADRDRESGGEDSLKARSHAP